MHIYYLYNWYIIYIVKIQKDFFYRFFNNIIDKINYKILIFKVYFIFIFLKFYKYYRVNI